MHIILRHWAGVERRFALDFGLICDLEEACGSVGIGEIYMALAQHRYRARYVYSAIKFGLRGGGMAIEDAERLVRLRFSEVPLADSVALAIDLLIAVNEGIPPDATAKPSDPSEPIALGPVLANFAKVGISPEQVRAMRYADFVLLMRSIGGDAVQPPSEDEYFDMIRKYEDKNGHV